MPIYFIYSFKIHKDFGCFWDTVETMFFKNYFFCLKLNLFMFSYYFWYANIKNNFFKINKIYIILIYLWAKNILNHNRYDISKYNFYRASLIKKKKNTNFYVETSPNNQPYRVSPSLSPRPNMLSIMFFHGKDILKMFRSVVAVIF